MFSRRFHVSFELLATIAMVVCGACNEALPDSYKFCFACGSNVDEAQSSLDATLDALGTSEINLDAIDFSNFGAVAVASTNERKLLRFYFLLFVCSFLLYDLLC